MTLKKLKNSAGYTLISALLAFTPVHAELPHINARPKKAYTLIELLVVITIIAILIVTGTAAYINSQQKGRDFKRKAHLAAIQQALELFYADNGAYPLEQGDYSYNNIDILTCDTGPITNGIYQSRPWGGPFNCNGKTYMNQLPDDPNYPGRNPSDANDHGYIYEIFAYKYANLINSPPGWCQLDHMNGNTAVVKNCQQYTLWTTLENPHDPDIQKTLNDPVCKLSIRYETLGGNPPYTSDWDWNLPYGQGLDWAPWAAQDPDRTFNGTRNYCVHGPLS